MEGKCYHTKEGYLIPICWGTAVHYDIDFCHCQDENDDKTFTIRDVKEKISELENKTKVEGFETCKELHQAQNDIQVLKRVLVLLK